jgi:hypothetical protein
MSRDLHVRSDTHTPSIDSPQSDPYNPRRLFAASCEVFLIDEPQFRA